MITRFLFTHGVLYIGLFSGLYFAGVNSMVMISDFN